MKTALLDDLRMGLKMHGLPADLTGTVQNCGFGHRFGHTRRAVGYYDREGHDDTLGDFGVRTFVCFKHARQAERVGTPVVWNGGVLR